MNDEIKHLKEETFPPDNNIDNFEKGYTSKYYFPYSNPEEICKIYNTFSKKYRKKFKTK